MSTKPRLEHVDGLPYPLPAGGRPCCRHFGHWWNYASEHQDLEYIDHNVELKGVTYLTVLVDPMICFHCGGTKTRYFDMEATGTVAVAV